MRYGVLNVWSELGDSLVYFDTAIRLSYRSFIASVVHGHLATIRLSESGGSLSLYCLEKMALFIV